MMATAAPVRPHAAPPAFVSPRAAPLLPQVRPGLAAPQPVAAFAGKMGGAAPPSLPAPGIDDSAVLLRFTGDIHAVVQAAATMPRAAVSQHREGRTQVRFAYLDGRVEAVAVVQSSRSRLLDDAALAAVQQAHYPAPPAPLRGRRLTLLEWIDFRIAPRAL
jgi:protein TonB